MPCSATRSTSLPRASASTSSSISPRSSYIDSAGIGVLIGRYLSLRRRGGDMKLANLTARSHRVMTITQLLDVFDCFDSIDEAVESFAIANR